jgi:multidrug resistance efflux pump
MFRRIMVTVLVVVAILAIAGGVIYWIYDGYTYYRTDDAQVTGQIVTVSAPAAGTLSSLNVKEGDTVTTNQVLGSVTPAPTGATAPRALDLTSPIDGTIVQVPAVEGQAVAPGLSLVMVTNLNTLNLTAYVDENSIDNVSVGQSVDITIDAYKGTSFTGHVQQIVQAAAGEFSFLPNEDPTSGNFTKVGQRIPVIITLDSKGGKDIVPGMSAEVTIHIH